MPSHRVDDDIGDEPTFPSSKYPTLADREERLADQDKIREPWQERYKAGIEKYWVGQEARVLKTAQTRADKPKPLLNPEVENAAYAAIIGPLQAELVAEFGQLAVDEVAVLAAEKLPAFAPDRPDFRKWLTENLHIRSNLIDKTSAAKLEVIIADTADQGFKVTSKAISEKYAEWSGKTDAITQPRSNAIARTEVGRADIKAELEGYKQSAEYLDVVIRSEWLTARDSLVRGGGKDMYSHIVMDGAVTDADGLFDTFNQVGFIEGPMLSGKAAFDIQCRCGLSPMLPGDKQLRPKT